MRNDPAAVINSGPMSRFQWGIVAAMIALNALDGFDVMSISFAAPGIAAEWGVDRAALGLVLSMELVGMAIGSLMLGQVADRAGRRPTIIGCLLLMTTGMLGAAAAHEVLALSGWRMLTGLGIGGMLAAINAAVAEAANARHRALAVVLMAAGYPFGTIIGGLIASSLLAHFDWRAVFLFGAAWSAAMIPLTLWRVPESVSFLAWQRGAKALERINATLARMGHGGIEALPDRPAARGRLPLSQLFQPALVATTVALTIAYLAHIMTFYFILKWIPKIVVDMNYPAPEAAGVLVWASIGGATGSLLLGLLTARVRLFVLTIAAMVLSTGLVILFGSGQSDLASLSLVAALAGFATNAGVVGLYGLIAQSFGTDLRGTATGFIIGIGRGGSAMAPAVAGILFSAGYGLQAVAVTMAMGSLVAAAALLVLARRQAAPAG
ncbi:MFS transporter [Rhizorhabdus sp. FW153]|uniref:MFS transporter n=1 Tax=Rhizorhabdus sp. FW153 TaxID=3400216 RepID=UPI003CE8BC27